MTLALEPLESDDQDLGCFVDGHLLGGEDEVFAVGTVPGILLLEGLRLFG